MSTQHHLKFLTIVIVVVTIHFAPMVFMQAEAWLLAQVGLNESYRVRHLSMHYQRVFLSISIDSKTFPTLIEAQWRENYLPMHTSIFPQRELHANGDHSDCRRIQQARWSQVDNFNRLWVFDIGWQSNNKKQKCAPKLLVFDLIRNNAEVLRIDCGKYLKSSDDNLLTVKMGPRPFESCLVEKYIYFLISGEPIILAYDILEQKWQRRQLIGKKFSSLTQTFPVKPIDMAFGKHKELLISDIDGKLYSTKNTLLKSEINSRRGKIITDNEIDTNATSTIANESVELKLLGNLLGPSHGMMVDDLGALYYVVSKYGAIVRCIYNRNLTTEDNEIIYMTSKNIQQIFFGATGAVWLLTDRLLKPQDHCYQDF